MHKDCLKNNIKIYITITLTCFGAVTPPKVTLAGTDNALPEDGVSTPKHVRAIVM